MAIKLKNALNSALSAVGGHKLGSVTIIGSGGPFDVSEGTTSLLLAPPEGGSILIDCGPTTYSSMRKAGLGSDISAIILTSSHESSIGSLATLVSHLYQANGPVQIACAAHISGHVQDYLLNVCGLPSDSLSMSNVLHGASIFLYESSPLTSALVLDFGKFRVVHSGQISSPVFDLLRSSDPALMSKLEKESDNTIVFHDASLVENGYGCHYERLSEVSEKFRNFFIFNHNESDGGKMIFSQRYMRSLSTNARNSEFIIEKQLGT